MTQRFTQVFRRSKYLALAGLLATAAPAPLGAETSGEPAENIVRPVVSVVLSGREAAAVTYFGQVEAATAADLGFVQAGKLAERTVRVGDVVAAGSLLATLDPTDLDSAFRAANATLAAAEADLGLARDAEDRARQLAAKGTSSAVELEAATLNRVAAEAAVEQARANLESARDLREGASLFAPSAGVILVAPVEPGANVQAGQPVVRLASLGGREVLVDLSEAELLALPEGAAFRVVLDVNPSIAVPAHVASVDPVAEKTTRTRRVHLALENPPPEFRIGALTRATLALEDGAGLLTLPESAVLLEGEASFVWRVVRPEGQVSRIAVTVEPISDGVVAIRQGLAPGDEVVLKGIHSLSEGQIVGAQVTP